MHVEIWKKQHTVTVDHIKKKDLVKKDKSIPKLFEESKKVFSFDLNKN